jgi:hypothetical protein
VLNLASLFLALAAFAVAWFSVYVTALRNARIEVDLALAAMEHGSGVIGSPISTTSTLSVTLFATNEGSSAGLLESITVSAPRANVDLWGNLEMSVAPAEFPIVIEGYKSRIYRWSYVYRSQVSEDPAAFEQFLQRVEQLCSIEIDVEWHYYASAGIPFLPAWAPSCLRTRRERRKRIATESVDVARYRESLANYWQANGYPELAARATSK